MKKLLILIFVLLISTYSNSQIISLHFFQFQEILKTEFDTTYSEIYNVSLTYNFDLTQKIVFTEINGSFIQETITIYSNNDNVITLVYTENASSGWILDLKTNRANYFELMIDSTKEIEIVNPIFIKTEVQENK